MTDPAKDEILWAIARRRRDFKAQVGAYIVINLLLWELWSLIQNFGNRQEFYQSWPFWLMIAWGIRLIFKYADAYRDRGLDSLGVQKEYDKLRKEHKL